MSRTNIWMVRADRDAHSIEDFRSQNIVAVGWGMQKPVADFASRSEIGQELAMLRPHLSARQRLSAASQLYRFAEEIEVGDRVITYDPGAENTSSERYKADLNSMQVSLKDCQTIDV